VYVSYWFIQFNSSEDTRGNFQISIIAINLI
jgi:hypothetical protein